MPEEASHTNLLTSIRELKNQDPFAPFDIVVASGMRYHIELPNNLVEMRTELFYAFPGGDKWVLIRINQIVSVEMGSGRASRRRRAS